MKNYYEILQVNENASQEIIEKAYKVLAKKYHPDLQNDMKKKELSEDKLKQINEAYDILSDSFLRGKYDTELQRQKEEEIKAKYGDKDYGTEKTKFYGRTNENQKNKSEQDLRREEYYAQKINARQEQYDQEEKKRQAQKLGTLAGVIDFVKVLYNDRPKRKELADVTKKDLFAIVLAILIVIAIGVILWCIPFTNGWIREILFENPIVKLFSK